DIVKRTNKLLSLQVGQSLLGRVVDALGQPLDGRGPIFTKEKWRFSGDYDTPDESRAFASSILEPVAPTPQLKQLKIEIALNYTMPEWTVKLLVYEKQSDADIRPTYSDQGTY
ncbi:MAG: hypothetical protein KGM98_07320, partial [Bacteroidota bacterium]|nr:hypothetical protein [Bacteroidota bacterium]